MNESDQERARVTRVLRALWIAFLGAPVIYLAVAFLMLRGRQEGFIAPPALRILKPVLAFAGVLLLAGAFFARRALLARASADRTSALLGLQVALLVGWTMTEAVGVLGLLLVVLGGGLSVALPFLLVSFGALVWQGPDGAMLRWREEGRSTH